MSYVTTLEPRGFRARRAWGEAAWRDREPASRAAERARRAAALSAELTTQTERAVTEVCPYPLGLRRDEPAAESNVAPTAADSSLPPSGSQKSLRTKLPSSLVSWRTSAVNRAER